MNKKFVVVIGDEFREIGMKNFIFQGTTVCQEHKIPSTTSAVFDKITQKNKFSKPIIPD